MKKFYRNTLFEFNKIKIMYYIFLGLFFCLSIIFLFYSEFTKYEVVNVYTNHNVVAGEQTSFYNGAYYWQSFIMCGIVGFLLLSALALLISYKLFGSDVKEKVLLNQLLLPLSRIQIIFSKIIVLVLAIVSIILIPFLLESIGFAFYSFGNDKSGSFYYSVMILNYLNFTSVMLLTSFIFAAFYVLIPKLSLSNWIAAIVFLIFAQATCSYFFHNYLISQELDPNKFHQVFKFFGPFALSNSNLLFIEPTKPDNLSPGNHTFSYDLDSYNLGANGWKIPLGMALASGLGFPIIWKFNIKDLPL